MVAPEYISSLSLVENKTKIMGNTLLANQIREIVKLYINHNKDLYETQSKINAALISRFGIDWYERSKEAVNFIYEKWRLVDSITNKGNFLEVLKRNQFSKERESYE